MSRILYDKNGITLVHGDSMTIDLPTADLILTDPPYGTTELDWDVWPKGWPARMAEISNSMWCFGAMRMFLENAPELLATWKHGHEVAGVADDIVWEKQNGTGFATDRFRRIHEHAVHFYRGAWENVYHETQTVPGAKKRSVVRRVSPSHTNVIAEGHYNSWEGGPKLMTSVLRVRNMHHSAIHDTEKPLGLIIPLLKYGCPPGGLVVDPFGGSASTALAARMCGRRAFVVEANEAHANTALKRLLEDDKSPTLFG